MLDSYKCAICLETMTKPATTLCGHNFCLEKCLKPAMRFNNSCPMCREPVPRAPLVNTVLQEAIENATSVPKTADIPKCGECYAVNSTKYCTVCKLCLCDQCSSRIHELNSFQSHRIVHVAERSSVTPTKCQKHNTKDLEYFCNACQKAVCVDCCVFEKHFSHTEDLIPIQDARSCLEQKIASLDSVLNSSTNQTLTKSRKAFESFRASINRAHSTNLDYVSRIRNASLKRAKQLSSGQRVSLEPINTSEFKKSLKESIDRCRVVFQDWEQSVMRSYDDISNLYQKQLSGNGTAASSIAPKSKIMTPGNSRRIGVANPSRASQMHGILRR
ncbi:hypothetical protein P9112_009346 [Eukaryota sp. TZLM1-RC]